MEKSNYNSPKVKEINLSIKRSVCQNVSPNALDALELGGALSDDFAETN